MTGAQDPEDISTKILRIAVLAKEKPELCFTSLAHHIDIEWLREAYRRTRKDGAPGIDGQTGGDYEANLEDNLRSLLERFKSGRYRAPPVRRAHIPKGDGKEMRPLGIPTFEDKVLQRAVVMMLEAIYECDFLPCSYGFRTRLSAHDALEALWKQAMDMRGCWLLEVDLRKFFDTVDPRRLQEILRQRVRDGVLLRAIGKWLKAGVMEDGRVRRPSKGTPQGGVISPLLANVYLHEVLDTWFEREVKPRLRGRAYLVRYADDFVMGYELETDAQRVMAVLPKRLEKYGLAINRQKTRLVDFRRPKTGQRRGPRDTTFDFLGFTHFWGLSRKGNMVVRSRTASKRMTRSLKTIHQWCRAHRHFKVHEQHAKLLQKLRGHDEYFGRVGNSRAIWAFHREVERHWRYWLDRRGQRRSMPWPRFAKLLKRYPLPRLDCGWPRARSEPMPRGAG